MKSAFIVGDVQAPCHDRLAWEVALQIGEKLKPDIAIINGDFVEWRHLSTHYIARKLPQFGNDAKEETTTAKEMLLQFKRRVKAKEYYFNEGNHEWRLARAISQSPQLMELLGFDHIKQAFSVDAMLGLTNLGFKTPGGYPKGFFVFPDVYIYHSYVTRKKAGYMAHSEIDSRLCSTVTGHGERLAVIWRRGLNRRLFAAEGGNLSILGEPTRGAGIYGSVPFNEPEFMDRQQGLVILYQHEGMVIPEAVPIHHGKTIWRGKLYKA